MTLPAELVERLRELLVKLEGATVGSRELDAEIAVAIQCTAGYIPEPGEKLTLGKYNLVEARDSDGQLIMLPQTFDYTKSLDAAIALVAAKLPDHEWGVSADLENGKYDAFVADDNWDESFNNILGRARTPALALLAALLRSIQGEK